jgi:leucyl-tRNA synthetase
MSKSLGNVVTPDEMVARYGADSARMYSLFAAPPDRDLDWQDASVEGIYRFLGRVHRFVSRHTAVARPVGADIQRSSVETELAPSQLSPQARALQRKLHQTIKRVSTDFQGRWHFNTSIAAIMELVNQLHATEEQKGDGIPDQLLREAQRDLVLLMAPFAPYLAHELWEMLGERESLLHAPWPKYEPGLAREEEIEIPVQVNGKLRSRIVVSADASEEDVRQRALADEKVQSFIAGKQVVKIIIVPGKLVNIVVR